MKFMKKMFCSVLALMMIVSLAACNQTDSSASSEKPAESGQESEGQSSAAEGKIVINDQAGRTVELDSVPERICTTIIPFPSIYYALMGDNDIMVGCNPSSMKAYDDSPLRNMYPKMADCDTSWVSRDFTVNVEEVLKLKPDVVFQWVSQPKEIKKMEDAGLKVVALKYGTQDDVDNWLRIIGTMFHKEDRAEELIANHKACVKEVTDRTEALKEEDKVKTLFLYGDMQAIGDDVHTNTMLENSGAANVAKEASGYSSDIDMEQVLKWNPDVIYIGNFTEIQPSDLIKNKLKGEDWSQVKAVKNGQVYKAPIGGYRWDVCCVESSLMVKWMAKIEHPELFKDMDMKQEVKDFYKEVYDFDVTDEMLSEILNDTQN